MDTKAKIKNKYKLTAVFIFAAILLVVVSCMTFSMFNANAATIAFSGGDGTTDNPYVISTEADLLQLADDVNGGQVNGYYGNYFKLESDLDLTVYGSEYNSGKGWTPIGNITYPFKGNFYGDGHAINNLYINDVSSNYLGLFGYINSDSVVENITIENSTVQGQMYIGGIAGQNEGTIAGCNSSADVICKTMFAGGIVGYNQGTINNSSNNGVVSADTYFAGGIAGTNTGNIGSSYNSGTINGYSCGGGIAGNNSGSISECYNIGLIDGHDAQGGIIGTNEGSITNCYNVGTIKASTTTAGGITGSNDSAGIIKNIYNIATINAVNISGALAGYNVGTIEAGFFDKEIYSGASIGSGVPINNTDFSTYDMTNADALLETGKLGLLNVNSGEGKWAKRAYNSTHCYYPELSVFYSSADLGIQSNSKTSVQCERMAIDDAEVSLNNITFVYNGKAQKPTVKLGLKELTLALDYSANFENNLNVGAENSASIAITFINYYKGTATRNFSITKAPLEVIWDEAAIVYNGAAQYPVAYGSSGKVEGENLTFIYSGFENNINAGEYSVTVSLDNTSINDNYYFESVTHTYSIEKKPIQISWDTEALVYNGNAQNPTANISEGKIGTENITLVYSGYMNNINAVSDAIYSVVADLEDTLVNANYYFEQQSYSYTISKKQLNASWDNSTLSYNGKPQHPQVNNIVGKIGDENVTFTYSGYDTNINSSNGSTYSVTATLADTIVNANYLFSPETTHYDISKAAISITWANEELVYNGTAQYPQAVVSSGAVIGEQLTLAYSGYESNINASIDKSYSVSVYLADTTVNANYSFTTESINYAISKAPVTVAWNGTSLVYNGLKQCPVAIASSGLFLTDTINFAYSNYSGVNAGNNYSIDISSLNTNYYVENALVYSIAPAPITIAWENHVLVYNGTVQHPNAVIISGLFQNETAELEYLNFLGLNVGDGYTINILSTNENYHVQNTLTYSINPLSITLAWNESLYYNGSPQYPTATVESGIVGNDIIVLEYYNFNNNISASIGNAYSVSIRLANNDVNKNYVLNQTVKTYDIAKAEIVIAWEAEIHYNGQNQHPTAMITTQVYDNVGLRYSNYNAVDAGEGYTITIESDNPNYTVSNSLTYSIQKAILKVEWSNEELFYNGSAQHPIANIIGNSIIGVNKITFSYSGFENNIRTSSNNSYSVTLVLNSNNPLNENFCFDETAGKYYDIQKKSISITDVFGVDRSYDGTLKVELSGGLLNGVLDGDNVTFILGSGELLDANVGENKSLTTSITLSGADADQYDLVQPEIFVTIKKAVLDLSDISFDSKYFIYSGTAKKIFISGELPDGITVVYSQNEQIKVGSYKVTARFILDDEDNYEPVESKSAYIHITKASYDISNISFNSQTFANDGNSHSIYIVGDLPIGVTVLYENNGQAAVGAYEITVKFVLEDTDNFEQLENLTAYLYITPSVFEYTDDGIKFEVSEGYVDYEVTLSVKKSEEKRKLQNGTTSLESFDITFEKNGIKVQPNARIKITITLSEDLLKQKNLQLFHIRDSGELESIVFEIIDGKIVFYANEFSIYTLTVSPQSYLWYILSSILLILIIGIIIFYLKKKRTAFALNSKKNLMALSVNPAETKTVIDTSSTEDNFSSQENKNEIKESNNIKLEDTEFYIDGTYCRTFESFCESLKYKSSLRQAEVCKLSAEKAKRNAQVKNWEKKNELYWKDKKFKPNSSEHLNLLSRGKEAQSAHLMTKSTTMKNL